MVNEDAEGGTGSVVAIGFCVLILSFVILFKNEKKIVTYTKFLDTTKNSTLIVDSPSSLSV